MSRARFIRWSLMPGFAALTLLMVFASDVIAQTFIETPMEALALAGMALAAISMAGAVLSSADQGVAKEDR